MPVHFRFLVFTFLAAVFLASSSDAQTQTPTIRTTETVVVTATGRETPQSTVGATLTVLTSEQIEQRHALSTIDLLRTVPAVMASRAGGVGNLTSLWVRGGESTYNKVLLDGIPLNEPGGFFNFASLAPENIERIEVLRGAHSALFGSDAMASVIQIFSVRSGEGERPRIDLTADGGTYSTAHVAAGLGARTGTIEYRVFGSRLHTDNREPNNEHDATTFSGSFGARRQAGGALKLLARTDSGRTGTPGQTAFRRADMDAFFDHRNADFHASWEQPLGARIAQRASYAFARGRQTSTNLVTDPPYVARFGDAVAPRQSFDFLYDSVTRLHRQNLEYRIDATLRTGQTLTAAFAYDAERGVLTDRLSGEPPQRPKRDSTGTTVQYESLTGPVSLIGGVRFEDNGSFGFSAAPRAALSWLVRAEDGELNGTRVRASAGLGIKEPSFFQSYSTSPFARGNPDLEPERSRGYDVGIEHRFAGTTARVEAVYFANHFDDLISLGPSDPASFESRYENIGETRASGVELSGDVRFGGNLHLRGHYALLDSEVLRSTSSSPIFQAGRPLFRRPRHSGSIDGAFTRARLTLTVGAIVVGSRVDTDSASLGFESSEGYTTVNATADVRLGRRTSSFITIDNLGNDDYMDPLGYRGLGRAVRAGVRTRF